MINNSNVWEEIKNRGYEIGPDVRGKREGDCEQHTVYGLRTKLNELGILNNKLFRIISNSNNDLI